MLQQTLLKFSENKNANLIGQLATFFVQKVGKLQAPQ